MLRCLLPASGCVCDVALALSDIGSPHSTAIMSAVALAAAAVGTLPVLARVSRAVVGIDLHEPARRPQA